MKTAYTLFAAVLLLFSLGILMVFNTTSAEVIDRASDVNSHLSMIRQICFALFGVGLGAIVYKIGYKTFIDKSFFLYGLIIIGLILVFVPKIGMHINGAYRWLNIFGISLQPSEFVKVILPLVYIKILRGEGMKKGFIRFCLWQIPLVVPIFMILIEPDNGTAAILLTTLVVLYFLTRIRWYYFVLPIAVVVCIGGTLALSMQHVSDRIYVYLHPETDLLGKGHQPYQSKIAAGSGGLFGRGLGESIQKLHYLPEARSDYIAAIYAEEFGFLGVLFLITLYLLITTLGFQIATYSDDVEGYYLATILTFILAFQAFLNLGIVSGFLPSKGTNLPFFSQGGSSLLTNILALAMLLNIKGRKWRNELQSL
jgi:cell division protein FtsW